MADVALASSDSNEYEMKRAANMMRNEEIMKMLGLDKSDFFLHEEHKSKNTKKAQPKPESGNKKRKLDEDCENKVTPARRSARQMGVSVKEEGRPEPRHLPEDIKAWDETKASKEEHDAAEDEHVRRWAGRQGKQTIVGTASYQHTLKRVMTMSEDALERRMRAIERACGKFAVIKMRLFARVLCLEGYEELSYQATESLNRLIAILGEPEQSDEEEK
eukprot:CAMPEP_0181315024 /NCGR_PEP_ID=MMETSP1101-20121128/15142_1 /TAXON_ID=46948 /ORGANISM="Rhodomonas abbreviata, Strain Caron Lab Isolate" /LENGTH=217 /DNA_ID=CAMNT_0023422179 /DNA_START=69 /DNA_END=722 /DNA_ORIENTATION=-